MQISVGFTRPVARRAARWLSLLGCLAVLAAGGCSGGSGGKVKGKVTLAGQPLPDAEVVFFPEGNPRVEAYAARTDAGGGFAVATAAGVGVSAGRYKVAVRKF